MQYAEPIQRLIKALSRLPGIGGKTATRLALFVLNSDKAYADELAGSLTGVKEKVGICSRCMTFSDADPCPICNDESRDRSTVCVVGDYKDMAAIEAAGTYRGVYHILHGLLAPLKGIGPEEIRLGELLERVGQKVGQKVGIDSGNGEGGGGALKEVILATGFDGEGEATAAYIMELLKPSGIKLTRIASGVPMGSHIEYMDQATLGAAMDGRREV